MGAFSLIVVINLLNRLKMDSNLSDLVESWFKWDKNPESIETIANLKAINDIEQLSKLMLKRLEFGTAGLRARMGPGFSQMNDLIIIQTTQGVAAVMKDKFSEDVLKRGVVIGFDKRHNSDRFAKIAAAVFLLSDIPVYSFHEYAPTPYVAFGVRNFHHAAGVMITASHNPKEDNGYKLYWSNGSQIIPPYDCLIQDAINNNLEPKRIGGEVYDDPWNYDDVLKHYKETGLLTEIDSDYAASYNTKLDFLRMPMYTDPSDLKITYTAMHGVGYKFVVKAFDQLKLPELVEVEKQCQPDPEFPTVKYPNPEEGKEALDLSIQVADAIGSTVILANDPDADRLAVAEKLPTGTWKVLSGNELGTLIGWWLLENHKHRNSVEETAPKLKDCYMLSSTVSSRFLSTMAEGEGLNFEDTLTGFKWMGNRSDELIAEGKTVLFAFEEAIGYMCGSTVLDKDGVSAACVVAQLVHYLRKNNSDLVTKMGQIFAQYGLHVTFNSYYFCYESETIAKIFERIRSFDESAASDVDKYPKFLNGIPLKSFRDLTAGIDSAQPDLKPLLPTSKSSQMITFYLSNGIVLTVRTSGTEPKIKFYSEFIDKSKQFPSTEDALTFLKMHMRNMTQFLLEPNKHGLKPAMGMKF